MLVINRPKAITATTYLQKLTDPEAGPFSLAYLYLILSSVAYSTVLIPLCTVPNVVSESLIAISEHVIGSIMSFDALIKFISAPVRNRIILNPWFLLDLLNGIPYILFLTGIHNESYLRLFYLLRVSFRLFKITKHSPLAILLFSSFRSAGRSLILPLYFLIFILLLFTMLMTFFESNNPGFQSIWNVIWFSLVTSATVGFGDVVPRTAGGKITTSIFLTIGIIYMAIPIGVIGLTFQHTWSNRNRILQLGRMRQRISDRGVTAADIQEAFDSLDSDKSGEMELQEFKVLLEYLELSPPEKVVVELFKTIDSDSTGRICLAELGRAIFPDAVWQESKSVEPIKKSFEGILDNALVPLDILLNRISKAVYRSNSIGREMMNQPSQTETFIIQPPRRRLPTPRRLETRK